MIPSKLIKDRSRLTEIAGFFVRQGAVFPWVYYRRNISNEKTGHIGTL